MSITPAKPPSHVGESLYSALLYLYPRQFRQKYGRHMRQVFLDCYTDELRHNGSLARFWSSMFYDTVASAGSEHILSLIARCKRLLGLEQRHALASASINLNVGSLTDIGRKRAVNEDTMISIVPEDPNIMAHKGALFVVADGMGGHMQGEIASNLAVKYIHETYYQDTNKDPQVALRHATEAANREICRHNDEQLSNEDKEARKKGMGTTCVAAVLKDNIIYIANVGDSLAYIVRGDSLLQLAQDHSWVAEQVLLGKLTPEEAKNHDKRNVITRCLGTQASVEVYTTSEPAQDNDVLVLCTDGLHALIGEDEMRSIVQQYSPEESTQRLIVRANEQGGPDNITAVVVRISLAA
ncbi:Stp1/IreP family PP2C-type Ser/Thr phosphatase [Ktedonobacter racemifer]|uniref:Protein serine/threonine phosphatase n=1 Tax=Ktedonobacter racemifer DSM 44963 TaxID=485913 RepID=D6TUL5_KTERA|nr:Stp1/IreP family PP2C-type Ser/Thr phosphatase [Ktedonobacter racemifer]EFH84083.1 protein serine/threonine phosphatase [Ktedonobacter racemifer DSM 44963]